MSQVVVARAWDRVAIVEKAVRERGWNMEVMNDLAKQMGVDPMTVRRYWNRSRNWTRRTMNAEDVTTWRAQQVQLVDQAARKAFAEGRYNDVAALVKVAASIVGTVAPTKMEQTTTVSVQHSAAIGRVSAMTVDELRTLTGPVFDAYSEPVDDSPSEPVAAALVPLRVGPGSAGALAQVPAGGGSTREDAVARARARLLRPG